MPIHPVNVRRGHAHKMRSRILSLTRRSVQLSKTKTRRPPPNSNAAEMQHRFVHGGVYNTTRTAVAVQCSSIVMRNAIVEGALERGWDAGVAVDDDDGG